MRRAWIISCGSELTLGQVADTNAAWLARQLAAGGWQAERFITVPDRLEDIVGVLEQAAGRAGVVVMTGGLGPTPDDLTRAALAQAAGTDLELDPASLEGLRSFFAGRGREMPESNRVQALIPRGGRALANDRGTAPGIAIEIGGARVYALPGVPFEMRAMFARAVLPGLHAAGEGPVVLTRMLHTFGQPESAVGDAVSDLMPPERNPTVGTCASGGIIDVRITARAKSRAAAEAALDETEREVRGRLGEIVFGRDEETLGGAVGQLLAERCAALGTAESCTGGLIGELVTDVAGSSAYYRGGVVAYADEVKSTLLDVAPATLGRHGAVSEAVAREMAEGARKRLGVDYALSVTGIAGPGGTSPNKPVGRVYMGLGTPAGAEAREFRFGSATPRAEIRLRAARTGLNWLRLELRRR